MFSRDLKLMAGRHLQLKTETTSDAIDAAIKEGKAEKNKPTIIKVITEIGYGAPNKQGKASAHGGASRRRGNCTCKEKSRLGIRRKLLCTQ